MFSDLAVAGYKIRDICTGVSGCAPGEGLGHKIGACSRIPLLWEIGRGGGAKSYSVPGASPRWEPKTEIVNSHTALCPGACTKSGNVPEFCTHGETPCTKIPAWPGILYTQKVAVYKIPTPFF